MAELSSEEKDLLRAGGHKVTLYMSIMKPSTLLSALVNNTGIERGDRSIAYDTGTGTGYATIEAGQTLWIGSAAGGNDKGEVRIKSITGAQASGTITVAENAIDWSDGDHLTVLYNYELWPVFPLITDAGVFYKDYDVAYSDQNEEPPPVCICGPPRCGFLDSVSGEIDFTIEHANHYAVARGATISSYVVTCATASNISTVDTTTTITFNAAGIHWIKVSCTDSNTKSQVRMLPAFVYEAGVTDPYYDFEIEGAFQGSWTSGGWSARFNVFGDADIDEFPDSALIVIWHRAIYGSTEQFIGGWASAKNVLFAGYLRTESIRWDWEVGTVSFGAESITGLMRRHVMFSISIEADRSPDTWWKYDYLALTAARAIHHVWRWHSTLFTIADVFLPTDNTLLARACDDFIRSDLYAMVETFVSQHAIIAHACATKGGQLHVEIDAQVLSTAEKNAMTTVSDITEADRIGEITLERTAEKQASQANLSGFAYDGSKATPFIAVAPSSVPEDMGGQTVNLERQILDTQSQANEVCGRVLARANNTFRDVRVQFHGHYLGALDLMPQEWWTLTIAADDSTRGVVWTNQRLLLRTVTATFDAERGILQASSIYEKEAAGPDGVTGDYPVDPPTDPPTPPGPPSWPPLVQQKTGALVAFDGADGCWYRPPQGDDWEERDDGLPTGAVDNDNQGGWDPWWPTPEKQNTADPASAILFRLQDAHIYRSVNCGVTWEEVTPIDDPPNSWSDSPAPTVADVTFVQRVDNIHVNEQHIFLVEWQNGLSEWRSWFLKTEDDGISWEWVSLAIDYPSSALWTFGSSLEGWETHKELPSDADGVVLTWDSVEDATGDGGGSARLDVPDQLGNKWARYYFTPAGVIYRTTVLTVMSAEHKRTGDVDNLCYWRIFFTDGTHWSHNVGTPPLNWGTPSDTIAAGDAGKIISVIRLSYHAENAEIWLDDFEFTGLGVPDQTRVLWADLDSEDGTILWVTLWFDDKLYLQKRSVSDLGLLAFYALGAATQGEMEAETYIAYPMTPLGDHDTCYVFGRMSNPQSLGGVQAVIKTDDGGSNFSSVESGWGPDVCAAFFVDGATLYAIRQAGASYPASLYSGVGSLAHISNLPFGAGVEVWVDAFTRSGTGALAVGGRSAATVQIAFAVSPYIIWGDITDSFPGSAVRSLTYL